jgi:hypothetical protein
LGGNETGPSAPQEEMDWLKSLDETETTSAASQAEDTDWLKNLGGSESEPSAPQTEEADWLKGLDEPAAQQEQEHDWLKGLGEPESMPSSEGEDRPGWLKGLAFASGVEAVSHFAREEESDETRETPAAPMPAETEADFLNQLSEEPTLTPGPESTPSTMDLDQLGTSEQERDDSFAWLEGLAAKQGATEGLLTNPEERLEDEPEWVKQAKGLKSEPPVPQASTGQPSDSLEDLGKSEHDQDDAFAWLESLAAKQGATEGLLTKPEDRLEEEPEWVKQAKDLNAHETVPSSLPPEASEQAAAVSESQPTAEKPAEADEVEAWLKNLEGEATAEPAAAADETAIWLKGLEEEEAPQIEPAAETPAADLPEWMQNVQVAPEEKSPTIFAEEAELSATWMPPAEEPAPTVESKAEEEALPSWLGELDKEEEQISTPTDAGDLPAWLLAEETAPAAPEPTIYSDWKPVEKPREEEPEPAPLPAPPFEMAEAETVLEPEQPKIEPEPAPVLQTHEPALEPAPRPKTGGPSIPTVDPVLALARDELAGNNVNGALVSYGKLIKKARYLDEVIYDLREAQYRYPVDVNLWQSLGDAYMRANRLQDALDAYTKAEELLR